MKKKVVTLLMVLCMGCCVVGCGKETEADAPSTVEESSVESRLEGKPVGWKPREEVSSSVESNFEEGSSEESTIEVVEPTEESSSEGISEGSSSEEIIEEPSSVVQSVVPTHTEDDLVRVEIPEANLASDKSLCENAPYSVIGDEPIDESIDFQITLDSPKIRQLITEIYQGTGCTSHTVSDEYYAIFDYDPFDYAVTLSLSNGEVYHLYLYGGMCFALKED